MYTLGEDAATTDPSIWSSMTNTINSMANTANAVKQTGLFSQLRKIRNSSGLFPNQTAVGVPVPAQSNTMMYVGIGAGLLLLVGGIVYARRKR